MLTVFASELVRLCSDNRCYIFPLNVLFCFSSKWFQPSAQVWTLQKIHSIRQACGTSVPRFSLLGLLSRPLVSGVSCLNSSPSPHLFVCLKVFPQSSFLHFCLHTIQFCFVLAKNTGISIFLKTWVFARLDCARWPHSKKQNYKICQTAAHVAKYCFHHFNLLVSLYPSSGPAANTDILNIQYVAKDK